MSAPVPLPPRPGPGADARRRAEMLRVDHAGELAAVHIYRGQRAVLGAGAASADNDDPMARRLAAMEAQEAEHLARFDALLTGERVRPSLLAPIWRLAGFTLGAGTALLGEETAMACTEAVETVIEAHYAEQIAEVGDRDARLAAELTRFRDDELAHRDEARAAGADEAPFHPLLSAIIRTGCRAAIGIAGKI